MRSINWPVARITTLFLFCALGVFYFISFLCTLRPFWIAPFLILSGGGWFLFYHLLKETQKRWRDGSKEMAFETRNAGQQKTSFSESASPLGV